MNQTSNKRPDRLPAGSYPAMLTAFHDDGAIDWDGVDRLTDFCVDTGAAGIFACGLSAEISEMNDDEKGQLAECIVRRAAGRIPVVAGAITSGPLDRQAELIRRVHGSGADAVTISVCQLAEETQDDNQWIQNAQSLLDRFPDGIRFSLYECPWPYHRLLGDEALRWAAQTGRFHFMKDTSCCIKTIRGRLEIVGDGHLQLLNANTATLLSSLYAGCSGFCGIGANYMPELFAWLCEHWEDHPDDAAELHDFLDGCLDLTEGEYYPASAKEYVRQRGLSIGTYSRKMPSGVPADFREKLTAMRTQEGAWRERLLG